MVDYAGSIEGMLDNILIQFLNFENVYKALSKEKMPQEGDGFDYRQLRKAILENRSISDAAYVHLLEASQYTRNELSLAGLSIAKIEYLIRNILNVTLANYVALKKDFPDQHIALLETDISVLLKEGETFDLEAEDLVKVLESGKVKQDAKISIVKNLDSEAIKESTALSAAIGKLILSDIAGETLQLNTDVLISVIKAVSRSGAIKLLNRYFDSLDNDNMITLVSGIGEDYKEMFIKQHKPKFKNTEDHITLFTNLQTRGLIKQFKEDSREPGMIRVIANYQE